MRRLALILAVVAAVLSGGGLTRVVHMAVAHGGGAHCSPTREVIATDPVHACGSHRHGAPKGAAPCPHDSVPRWPSDDDGCAACVELALNAGELPLTSPFLDAITLLAIVHSRDASLLPDPQAPKACAARPPPRVA
ncbi:MAG: hypothetical protein ACO3QC_00275 [Phycisphaerales bacterium]